MLLALVAGCGGGGESAGGDAPGWSGPAELRPLDGTLETAEFERYADAADAPWEQDPERLAREFLRLDDGAVSVEGETAVLLRDDLQDDSVRAERWVLELDRDGDEWRLLRASWEQRCHVGRGQQDFRPELCI